MALNVIVLICYLLYCVIVNTTKVYIFFQVQLDTYVLKTFYFYELLNHLQQKQIGAKFIQKTFVSAVLLIAFMIRSTWQAMFNNIECKI